MQQIYRRSLMPKCDFNKATNTVRNKRSLVCTTENHLKNLISFTVPGNSNYASIIKNGRKVLVVGDSHVKRIRRNDFNNNLKMVKLSFSGANAKQLDHYILLPLVDEKPDAVIIYVDTTASMELTLSR